MQLKMPLEEILLSDAYFQYLNTSEYSHAIFTIIYFVSFLNFEPDNNNINLPKRHSIVILNVMHFCSLNKGTE